MTTPQSPTSTSTNPSTSIFTLAKTWGLSPLPPTALAALITAQALRPPTLSLPLLFPPILLGCTYLNISSHAHDAAGITAAWSGLYLLLARRRKVPLARKFGARGIIRGVTVGVCGANLVAGGWVYASGKREGEGEGA